MKLGPVNAHCAQTYREKYLDPGETFDDGIRRQARALSDDAEHEAMLYEIFGDQRYMAAGRVQSAAGSIKNITPFNCFVMGTIHDSFVHGNERGNNSIMDIATQAATTMRMGGGVGYDFSTLRPAGAFINGPKSNSDGPIAFMPINDAVCKATSSAGNRRGAQMGVLRIDHPDVFAFVRAKQPGDKIKALWDYVENLGADVPERFALVQALQETLPLTGFNISLAVTDDFMEALICDKPFELKFEGKVYDTIDPRELWAEVMDSTWNWAEPGVLFIDQINRMNNLYYCETIAATNPCGEQPLPPYGACLLGSQNLVKYLRTIPMSKRIGSMPSYDFDWELFEADIPHIVRAMDNVIDIATFPLPQQEREAKNKRRLGLGITGLANAAEALGYPYGSAEFLEFEARVLRTIAVSAYAASVELAKEKGAFPLFDAERYCNSEFIKQLPPELIADIRRFGIRNSHLTSIAPTGTISYTADNISSSIEPVFMYEGKRKMKTLEGEVEVDVNDYGFEHLKVKGKTADQVTAQEHLEVLATASGLVDSAVSKTCNVPADMPKDDFNRMYTSAWEMGCKGITTFQPAGKRLGIFTPKEPGNSDLDGGACAWVNGVKSCE